MNHKKNVHQQLSRSGALSSRPWLNNQGTSKRTIDWRTPLVVSQGTQSSTAQNNESSSNNASEEFLKEE